MNKNWKSCVKKHAFLSFSGVSEANSHKHGSYIVTNAYWTPKLVVVEFFKSFIEHFMVQKLYKKLHQKVKSLRIQSLSHILWSFWGTFLAWEVQISSQQRVADPVALFLQAFVHFNQKKSLRISEINKNFDIFVFLRSILSHVPTEVCKYVHKKTYSFWVQSLLNVFQCSDSKTIQSTHKLHNNVKMLKFLTPLESFWSIFAANRCNVFGKRGLYSSFFHVWTFWNF